MSRKRVVPIAIAVLVIGGLVASALEIRGAQVARRAVAFAGPTDVWGLELALRERRAPGGLEVDMHWGDDVVAVGLPLNPNARADQQDYTERYADQIWLYAPTPKSLPWHIVVADRSRNPVVFTRFSLSEVRPLPTYQFEGDPTVMRANFDRDVLDTRTVRASILPAPVWILLGALSLLWTRPSRPPAAPTLSLAIVMAATSLFVAWPVMLHLGPARSVPPALLAFGLTTLVALGMGPRWQRSIAAASTLKRLVGGVLTALVLLAVFTVVWVQINGFMTPVFRPPGTGPSPGEWFMRDVVAPSLAVGGMGLLPALLSGLVYGKLLRER